MVTNQYCVCGNTNPDLISPKGINFSDEKRLFRCSCCGTMQIYPYPVESNSDDTPYQGVEYMPNISEKEYYGYFRVLYDYFVKSLKIPKEARILDFGSGKSYYQYFFNKHEYSNVTSCEINKALRRYTKVNLGIDNVCPDVSSLESSTFELIYSNQVFEHLYNPVEMIDSELLRLLKPGGFLCFAVPNQDSLNRVLLANQWIGYSPEDHLWFFNESSVRHIFSGNKNFDIFDIRVCSAVNTKFDGFSPKSIIKKLYYHTFMRVFELFGRGDQLIVVLKKKVE